MRQLAIRDDPEALLQWFREDAEAFAFVVSRLAELAPAKAAELVRGMEDATPQIERKALYTESREMIEGGKTAAIKETPETEEGRRALAGSSHRHSRRRSTPLSARWNSSCHRRAQTVCR